MDGPFTQPGRRQRRPQHVPSCHHPGLLGRAGSRGVALFFTGDVQGKLMFQQQPMKMASAESLCDTETDPDFSILTVGTHNNCDGLTRLVEVPYVLPFLAKGRFDGVTLQGVATSSVTTRPSSAPGDYRPNLFVTYWSFRAMIGFARRTSVVRACWHCG